MSGSLPSIAKSDECTEVVNACDKALADQDKVINFKTATIKAQDDVIGAQNKQIAALEKDKNSIFRSPWLYFGLGIVTSAVLLRK